MESCKTYEWMRFQISYCYFNLWKTPRCERVEWSIDQTIVNQIKSNHRKFFRCFFLISFQHSFISNFGFRFFRWWDVKVDYARVVKMSEHLIVFPLDDGKKMQCGSGRHRLNCLFRIFHTWNLQHLVGLHFRLFPRVVDCSI